VIFTVSLPGAILANVRYQWLVAGALGGALSSGITAVDALFPWEFRIEAVPPTNFEELYAYDVTDATNYTKGRPQISSSSGGPTADEIADAILARNIAGGSSSGRIVSEALAFLRNKWEVVNGVLTIYDADDTTVLWTSAIASDASAAPVTGSDPT
jgi:hypothetical protein